MATIAILNEPQLRQLARIIYLQEAEATQNILFNSEHELATYLRECRANFDSLIGLLDGAAELKGRFQDDAVLAPIADDIYNYVGYGANGALQTVANYTLRQSYLEKFAGHVTSLTTALQELGPGDDNANAQLLAEEAVIHKDAMLDYISKFRSSASRNFSLWVKDTGMSFEELVQMYQNKLNFGGLFENLEESQKIQVYEEIIEVSGRGRTLKSEVSRKSRSVAGVGMLLFKAGMMAWEIFSAENKFQETTRQAVVAVARKGGAALGAVAGAALGTSLTGAQASVMFVVTAGIVGSIAGAFIIGLFAGWMFNRILSSGGRDAPLSTDGHQTYVAPLPDGVALAYQISHQTN